MQVNFIKLLKIALINCSCFLVISCSCSNTAGVGGNGDLIAPEVSATNPTKFKTKVPLNTFISASFNEEMNSNSITTETFYLKDENNRLIDGEVFAKAKTSSFKPAGTLNPFSRYSVTLERQITDLNGNRLIQDYQWVFTTGNEIDNSPPEITGVIPSENETEVDISTGITVSFSEYIDHSSVDANSFRLEDNAGNPVSGSLETNGTQIVFEPDLPLNFDTQYLLTVNTDIQDVAGNKLASSFVNYFTTSSAPDVTGPYVVNIYPKSDALNIATNSSISVTFNETLGINATDDANFIVTDSSNQKVDGIVTSRDSVLIFTPSTELSTKTTYSVTLKQAIDDVRGNTMDADFSWQFTTGDGTDTTPPTVSFVMPEIDMVNVANNNAITATFSEAIDPKTLGITKFTVQANGEYLDGNLTYSGTTAIFKPRNAMENNTLHTVTIASGISDLAGNLTNDNFTWNFTTGTARDNNIPRVSSVYPAEGASDFAVNSSLIVRFTEAMNPATLTPKTVYLQDSLGNIVESMVVTIGASSSVRPMTTLDFNEKYTAFITNEAEDLAENALAEMYSWSFTTASEEDITSPSIVSTVPASASQQAAVNRGIIVSFSEAIDAETIHQDSFYLTNTTGTLIPGTISVTDNTATLRPNTDLDYTKTYVATLLNTITDLSGNQLIKAFSWNFTTGSQPDSLPPSVLFTIPAENGLAAANHRIAIQFSEAMNTASLSTANIALTDFNGNDVGITVNAAERNTYIKPINDLAFDANYRIIVTTGVRDLANNNMANEFTLNFKTSLHPDLAPPFVVSTSPYSGETYVPISSNASVLFSEAIDCLTITNNHFQILNNTTPIAGTVNCSGDTLTITPSDMLPTQTSFTLQVTTDVRDPSGDHLEAIYQSNFTTAAWTQQTGTVFSEQAFSITADSNDNLITTGFTMGSFGALNAGNADVLLTKHSKSSILLWTQQFGSTKDDFATATAVDSENNIYITGYTYGDLADTNQGNSDIFIMKLDSAGTLLWQQQFGTVEDDAANDVAIDNAGNVLLAAYSFADFDSHSNSGQHDIVLIKLDKNGNKLWSQQWGSLEYDIPNAMSIDLADNIYLTGYTRGDLDANTNQGDADVFASKLDSNGALLWTNTLGSFLEDMAQAIALDSQNNIIITGFTLGDLQGETNLGSYDQFVAKLANDGSLLWYQQLGTTLDDRAYDIAVTASDDIVMAGYTAGDMQGTNAGKFDLLSVKLDTNGNNIWTTQLGSDEDDVAFTLTLDSKSNAYIGGYTVGSLDNITNLGHQDLTILKLNPNGEKQ